MLLSFSQASLLGLDRLGSLPRWDSNKDTELTDQSQLFYDRGASEIATWFEKCFTAAANKQAQLPLMHVTLSSNLAPKYICLQASQSYAHAI